MRLPQILSLILFTLLYSCNSSTGDKKSIPPKSKPEHQLKDAEFQKIRRHQDSLLELRQQKTKKKGLDSLKPVQA